MKIILFLISLFILFSSFSVIEPNSNFNYELTYARISNLSIREVEKLTGEKLGFKDEMSFKVLQLQVRKQLKNGTIDPNEKINFKNFYEHRKGKFSLSAFLFGLFLGLLGVLIVAISSKNKNDVFSAWIGFFVLITIILYIKSTNLI